MRLRPGKLREPDLLVLLDPDDPCRANRYWEGAALALGVMSGDKPEGDLVDKVRDYAEARIPEYWIANPLAQTIAVLILDGDAYAAHGVFARGQRATSATFVGFAGAGIIRSPRRSTGPSGTPGCWPR